MKQFVVQFADKAWFKIEAQVAFIAKDHQSPINAARWVNRLKEAIADLGLMQRRHTVDDRQTRELGEPVYRMVFERTYLVFYVVDDGSETVSIIDFEHGSRNRGN